MERCKKCILPLESVDHNEQGICKKCETYDQWSGGWDSGRLDFLEVVNRFRGKGRTYDFMVPLSGGKDSVFVLYYLTQVMPDARILSFTWDHGFHREQSLRNIESAVEATGVDHIVYRIHDETTTFKLFHGFFSTFGTPCVACILQGITVLRTAIIENTPLIITGAIEGQGRGRLGAKDTLPLTQKAIHPISEIISLAAQKVASGHEEEIVDELMGPITRHLDDTEAMWPSIIDLGCFINWNLNDLEVMEQLRNTLGFEKPDKTMTHTSCQLAQLRGYLMHKHRGLGLDNLFLPSQQSPATAFEEENSTLVRAGAISREQALKELELLGQNDMLPDILQHFLDKTDITMQEFDDWSARRPSPAAIRLMRAYMKL